jgi:hypothetical protein
MQERVVGLVFCALVSAGALFAIGGCSQDEPPKPEPTGKTSEAYRYCMYWDDATNSCTLDCESHQCEVTEVQSCNCRDSVGNAGNTVVTVCHDTCTNQVTDQYTTCAGQGTQCGGGGGGGGPPGACVDRGGMCSPGSDNGSVFTCCSGLHCNVDWFGGGDGNGVCE